MTDSDWVYFPGLPGSRREADIILPDGHSPKRVIAAGDDAGSLSNAHIVGFSLGAARALRLAATRPEAVGRLTLISAAAPLGLGDFLPDMAGRHVFHAARSPIQLGLLTLSQRMMLALTPDRMLALMFAGSADSELIWTQGKRRKALIEGYRESLSSPAYKVELRLYIEPWAHLLDRVTCPVQLYHGDSDDWAPLAMAEALAARLAAPVTTYPGLGHYGTLERVLTSSRGSPSRFLRSRVP